VGAGGVGAGGGGVVVGGVAGGWAKRGVCDQDAGPTALEKSQISRTYRNIVELVGPIEQLLIVVGNWLAS